MAQERSFTLVGKFKDNITPELVKITKSLDALGESLNRMSGKKAGFSGVAKKVDDSTEAHKKLIEQVKTLRSEISGTTKEFSQYNSGLARSIQFMGQYRKELGKATSSNKSFSKSSQEAAGAEEERWAASTRSIEGYMKAQGAAQKMAESMAGGPKGSANLLNTMLQANALTALGGAIAQGFQKGMGLVMRMITAAPRLFMRHFEAARQDEMSDIKAQAGMMGALNLAGYRGGDKEGKVSYSEAGKFFKRIDQAVAEEIRTSAAPTGAVIELQRYTSDTLVPLLMQAKGIEKGADVRKVDPKKITEMSKGYAGLLSQVALLAQGTGSSTIRVAQGVEGLISRGKIDTTMDFFTDNVLLMNALQKAGFAGGFGSSLRVSSLKTPAERLEAVKKALEVAMPSEGIEAMSTSLTGSLQALGDTISNPSVGLFGMAGTFTEKEQKKVNQQLTDIFNRRRDKYDAELKQLKDSKRTDETTLLRIKQLEIDRKKNRERLASLTKEGEEKVTTPFKAFSLVFGEVVRNLTDVLNAIGPIWNRFTLAALDITDRVIGPLATALGGIASDMRKDMAEGRDRLPFHVGRVVGEIYKFLGEALGALSNLLANPTGPMSEFQREYLSGFMAAFKNDPSLVAKAREGIANGISALLSALGRAILMVLTAGEVRPLVLSAIGLIFGPPVVLAVITGVVPLMVLFFGKVLAGLAKRASEGGFFETRAARLKRLRFLRGARDRLSPVKRGARELGGFGAEAAGLAWELGGRPGSRVLGKAGKGIRGFGKYVPGGAIAAGALDFGMGLASGEAPGKAASSGIGTILGATLGSLGGPVGTVIGSVAGGWIGEKIYDVMLGPSQAQRIAAEAQRKAAEAMEASRNKYGTEELGGVRALSDALGGGAGLQKMALNLLKSGELSQRDYTQVRVLSAQMADLNAATEGVRKAQDALSLNTNYNLGREKELSKKLEDAKLRQKAATDAITAQWKDTDSQVRIKILAAADVVSKAMVDAGKRLSPGLKDTSQGLKETPRSGPVRGAASGHLGEAISSEIRNKPSGSDLVIANSSETIIPAAGGLGMKDFMNTLWSGFSSISSVLSKLEKSFASSSKFNKDQFTDLNRKIDSNQNSLLGTLQKLTTGGSILGVGGSGNIISVGKSLLAMGLEVGENPFFQYGRGFLPGGGGRVGRHAKNSYHYLGRALDVSGPPALLDRAYSMLKGTNPSELLWRVPGHFDHLHVAYGLGGGSPAFFSSEDQARAWERKMAPRSASIATVTANSSEGFGGVYHLNSPITIYQQPNQDPEELATIVALRLGMAVDELRNH